MASVWRSGVITCRWKQFKPVLVLLLLHFVFEPRRLEIGSADMCFAITTTFYEQSSHHFRNYVMCLVYLAELP